MVGCVYWVPGIRLKWRLAVSLNSTLQAEFFSRLDGGMQAFAGLQ